MIIKVISLGFSVVLQDDVDQNQLQQQQKKQQTNKKKYDTLFLHRACCLTSTLFPCHVIVSETKWEYPICAGFGIANFTFRLGIHILEEKKKKIDNTQYSQAKSCPMSNI